MVDLFLLCNSNDVELLSTDGHSYEVLYRQALGNAELP